MLWQLLNSLEGIKDDLPQPADAFLLDKMPIVYETIAASSDETRGLLLGTNDILATVLLR